MRVHWVAGILSVLAAPAALLAVPYASGVTTSGSDLTFVLNQDADNVTLVLQGGGTINLGPLAKGTHNVTVPVLGNHQIRVTHSAPVGWTQISTDGMSTSFYTPMGVSVNRNKTSPHYGSVYVSNAMTGTTAFGRNTPEGIYRLQADMTPINNGTAGVTWGGSSGPWKSAIGADDRVYVTDLSDDLVFDLAPDLSSAVQLIDASNRTTNQWVASVIVEGTQAGGDRRIYLVNSNGNDGARKGLIRYDLGSDPTVATGNTGTQILGPSYWTSVYYPVDAVRDSAGNWYSNFFRWDPSQGPAVAKFLDGPYPINTAIWETPKTAPYNGSYCLDLYEEKGWVAYGNYYDGWVHIFNMADGSYVGGFDAGSRMRDIAFDAAGNIYTVDNVTEWLRVWSPGGDTVMETPFTIIPEPAGILLIVGAAGLVARRRR